MPLDAPVVGIGFRRAGGQTSTRHVASLRLDAALDEHFDAGAAAGCLRACSRSRSLITTRVGLVAGGGGELVERGGVGVLDRKRQERRRGRTRGERLFEASDQFLDRVGRRRRLARAPYRYAAARARHASASRRRRAMGGHNIRPPSAFGSPGTKSGSAIRVRVGQRRSSRISSASILSLIPDRLRRRLTARIVRSSVKRARRACAWTAARTSAPMAAGVLSAWRSRTSSRPLSSSGWPDGILRFGDAVAVEHEQVARARASFPPTLYSSARTARARCPVPCEPFEAAVAAADERRILSGVHVREASGRGS